MTTILQPAPTTAPPAIDVGDLSAADFLREHVEPGRPLLIRGALEGWPALERWRDPDYLVEAAGERVGSITNVDTGGHALIPLKEFWPRIFAGDDDPHAYINAILVQDGKQGVMGHLQSDVGFGPYLPPAEQRSALVFAGRDSRCGLHYHPSTEAFLCQIVGSKRVLLFPPEQSHLLYPIEWYSPGVCFSKAVFGRDGSWPDLTEFPALAETHPLECTVEPGQVLYIPIHWWHVVFGRDLSICATQMYRAALKKRFFTRMGLRSNYINGKVLRYNWRRLKSSLKSNHDD